MAEQDIVVQLREGFAAYSGLGKSLIYAAADEIERLRGEIKRLEDTIRDSIEGLP